MSSPIALDVDFWEDLRETRQPMLARQRQERILEALRASGGVRVSDLTEKLQVSYMTIRRDLDALAERGLVDKVHGGATIATQRSADEPGFEAKSLREQPEKEAIAVAAAQLVKPGTAIAVTAGTTTWALARYLRDIPNLTVVTNSIPVAQIMRHSGRTGPLDRAHRRAADAVGRAGRAGRRFRRCARCTSTCCSWACTAWTSAPG